MAAISVKVQLRNDTSYFLAKSVDSIKHGEWTDTQRAPEYVRPGDSVSWQSESDGFMTGTEGAVWFDILAPNIPADSSQATKLTLTWNAPYSGTNTCGGSVYGPNNDVYVLTSPEDATIHGDNATMSWILGIA